MEQNETPSPSPETGSASDASFGTLLTNVFASPREAFDSIASGEVKHMRWVAPFLVTLLLMLGGLYLMTSNPTFSQQMQDAQMAGFQKQVDEGAMTQAQADQIADQMGANQGMIMIFGSIAGSVFVLLYYVVGALFLWLAAKFILKAEAPFGKYLEIYGLSSWIGVIGGILTLMLMVGMDTMYASASAALAVLSEYDPVNTTHKILKSLDVFAAWQAVVAGIGLSAVAKKENGPGIGIALALWVVWIGVSVGLGLAR